MQESSCFSRFNSREQYKNLEALERSIVLILYAVERKCISMQSYLHLTSQGKYVRGENSQ